jgi:hypothetical protein
MRKVIFSILIGAVLPIWLGMAATIREPMASKAAPVSTTPNNTLSRTETIRGSLMSLGTEERVIVLKGEGGAAYNFKVTPTTKIEIEGKKAGFADLDRMTNSNISVTFIPTRQGNIARKIQAGQ